MTVHYRGTDRDIVIHSLQQAGRLLRALELGPETEHVSDCLRNIDWEKLRRVRDDRSFARFMDESFLAYCLQPFGELLQFVASTDREGVESLQLYYDLGSWGALDDLKMASRGYEAAVLAEIRHECDFYMINACVRRMENLPPGERPEFCGRVQQALTMLQHDHRDTIVSNALTKWRATYDRVELEDIYRGLGSWERFVLRTVLTQALRLDMLAVPGMESTPFAPYYMLVTPPPAADETAGVDEDGVQKPVPDVTQIFNEVSTFLKVKGFLALGQVKQYRIGIVPDCPDTKAIVLSVTSEVAEAVAHAFDSERPLYDQDARRVQSASGPSDLPPPAPC